MITPSGWINCWVEKWLKPHVHTCVGLNLTCFNYFKPRNRQEKQLPRNLQVSCLPWNRKNQSILVRITIGSASHKEFKQLNSSKPRYLVTLSNIRILACIYQYIYYICILLNVQSIHALSVWPFPMRQIQFVGEILFLGVSWNHVWGGPTSHFFGWTIISLQNTLWCNSNNYSILKRLPGYHMTGMSHHFYSIGSLIGIWMVLSPNPCHQGACPAISSEKGPKWSPVDGFDMAIDHPEKPRCFSARSGRIFTKSCQI